MVALSTHLLLRSQAHFTQIAESYASIVGVLFFCGIKVGRKRAERAESWNCERGDAVRQTLWLQNDWQRSVHVCPSCLRIGHIFPHGPPLRCVSAAVRA